MNTQPTEQEFDAYVTKMLEDGQAYPSAQLPAIHEGIPQFDAMPVAIAFGAVVLLLAAVVLIRRRLARR